MKLHHEEKRPQTLSVCERCAVISNPAVTFAECERDRMFMNLLRTGFRPV